MHPVNPFYSVDNLKNQSASVAFCGNLGAYNDRNITVIELSVVVSIGGFPLH